MACARPASTEAGWRDGRLQGKPMCCLAVLIGDDVAPWRGRVHADAGRAVASGPLDHKTDDRGARATDVQRLHAPRAFDLAVLRLIRHMPRGVEQHALAGGAYRVSAADQAAAPVDRAAAAALDAAVLDGLPALAGRRLTLVVLKARQQSMASHGNIRGARTHHGSSPSSRPSPESRRPPQDAVPSAPRSGKPQCQMRCDATRAIPLCTCS